jgi:hypothetical protein
MELQGGMVYTATITTMVSDRSYNTLATNYQWSFATSASVDLTAPVVTAVTPTNATTDVSINTPIEAAFSEALDATTVNASTFVVSSASGTTVTGTVSYAGGIASFTTGPLASNMTYSVTLTSGIKDLPNALATYVWTFTTAAAPVITTASLPDGTETGAYSFTLAATGGRPRTWSTASALPSGLSLSSAGVLSGTLGAATAGVYPISVTVTDDDGLTNTTALSLTVITGPAVFDNTLPEATATGVYSHTLTGTGGTAPYTWASGALPSGVTLDPSTGVLSSASINAPAGTYTLSITVTDSNAVPATKDLSLIVNAAPAITTAALPDGQDAIAYGPVALTMTGGTGTMTWNATALPASMLFDTATGIISGSPDPGTSAGSPYTVDFTVTDANGVVSPTATLTLTVLP